MNDDQLGFKDGLLNQARWLVAQLRRAGERDEADALDIKIAHVELDRL